MHDHEKQVLKDYIKTHPQKQETKKAESAASTSQPITTPESLGFSPGASGASAFGKRGLAAEEQFIRKHDQENIKKMQKKI